MKYTTTYESSLGRITLAADEIGITGLWIEGQKHFGSGLDGEQEEKRLPVFDEAAYWLDAYFSGHEPDFMPPLHFIGSDFQKDVWEILCSIPYGSTETYGNISRRIAEMRGLSRMSAQAVGGAIARNRIMIMVPCHRVVGAGGSLTGYAGGISKKIELLRLESAMSDQFFIPKKSTAP